MVCARTRGAMPAPRILHRRSHCCIRQPGSGTQILRGKRQEMVILHDSRHLRWNLSRLFCTILPLFTSIYKRGAGLGPAIAFLYSGPAISILSIILTARILGVEMGIARIVGAITFSIVIGLLMSFIFRKEEKAKKEEQMNITPPPEKRPMWQLHFTFSRWHSSLSRQLGGPCRIDKGLWLYIFTYKWYITGILALFFCWSLIWVLKLPVTWVLLGAIATTLSAFLANTFITDAKLVPLLPMIIGISHYP